MLSDFQFRLGTGETFVYIDDVILETGLGIVSISQVNAYEFVFVTCANTYYSSIDSSIWKICFLIPINGLKYVCINMQRDQLHKWTQILTVIDV